AAHGFLLSNAVVSTQTLATSPLTSASEALLNQAQSTLEQWLNGDVDSFVDGDFLQNWENLRQDPSLTLAERSMLYPANHYFDRYLGVLQGQVGEASDRAEAMVRQLYLYGGLDRYRRDFPQFGNFLKNQGGNCVAETLLIVQGLRYLGIRFQEPEVLGIEVFDDHVQPVVYNRNTQESWCLLSGEVLSHPKGDIYAPQIVLQGILSDAGRIPSATEQAFLIAEGSGPRTYAVISTDQRQTMGMWPFPRSGIRFHEGPVPEVAVLPPPRLRHPSPSENVEQPFSRSLEDLTGEERNRIERIMENYLVDYTFSETYQASFFRHRSQSLFYNSLPTYEEAVFYVFSLFARGLFERPSYARLLQVLEHPNAFFLLSAEEKRELVRHAIALNHWYNVSSRAYPLFQLHHVESHFQSFLNWCQAHPDEVLETQIDRNGHPLGLYWIMAEGVRILNRQNHLAENLSPVIQRALTLPITFQDEPSSLHLQERQTPSILSGRGVIEVELISRNSPARSRSLSLHFKTYRDLILVIDDDRIPFHRLSPHVQQLIRRFDSRFSSQLRHVMSPSTARDFLNIIEHRREVGDLHEWPRALRELEPEFRRRANQQN
ncbi:MAG: hypothetical protein JNK65_04175, partial [Deltaproteobacteria bacterium]|nr:hypothetical protein [Deltaproteobacteria bacterium]